MLSYFSLVNLLIPSTSSIWLPKPKTLVEPLEVANAPPNPKTLQIHQTHKTQKIKYKKI